jgi:flagellar biosynthetic protein FlhB
VAGSDKSQKTEKPTARKLKEAREKGQIAKSPELVTWTSLLLATVLVQVTVQRGVTTFRPLLDQMGKLIAKPDEARAGAFFGHAIVQGALVAAPLVLGLLLLTIVVNLGQVGLKPSGKRLKPQFSRLNALKGMKRMVSPNAWWELVKALLKVAILGAIVYPTIAAMASHVAVQGGSLFSIAGEVAKTALTVMRNIAGAGLVIAGIDYIVQRRRVNKELMMTKHEVLEEHKQHEGDPRVRQAIRSRQQAVSRNRMIGMVARADVVVVNPTHYAVALRYESARGAPEVLAKGADHLAARIRLEATRHNVPIVSEPALTRALYKACPVGARIPVELYEAVAHMLAFVFALRSRGRADGYHEFGRPLVTESPAATAAPTDRKPERVRVA